jgi:cold shock CspA family protein
VSTGKVIRFDEIRGYGFVSQDSGGDDVFLHVNDFTFDKRLVAPGTQLEFVAEESERGLKASQIRVIAPASKPDYSPEPVAPERFHREDDGLCDVLTTKELLSEFTEALLLSAPALTGEQILSVRGCLVTVAGRHGWIED